MKHFEFIEEQGERRTLLRKQPHRIGVGALGRVVVNLQTSDGFGQATRNRGTSLSAGSSVSHAVAIPSASMWLWIWFSAVVLPKPAGADQEQFGRCRAFQPLVDRASLQ